MSAVLSSPPPTAIATDGDAPPQGLVIRPVAGAADPLGAEVLGLDPSFPLKFMIYFLIVVTVGGTSSITGPFLAALSLIHI